MARHQGKHRMASKGPRKPQTADPRAKMKAGAVVTRVTEMITPLCAAEGMELVLVEYQPEPGGRVLRMIIDKPGGVKVEDCVAISRQTSDFLDVGLDIGEAYRLEVTSPGAERPLVRADDFNRFKGNMARIRTGEPVDGRKNFKGVLLGMSDGVVRLSVDGVTLDIPFERIERARLAG